MYIKSTKNKSYFMSKTRFFFLIIFDCLIILSFSGCHGFDLLFPSVGSGKKPEVGYSNTTTSNMDKNGKNSSVDVDIEMEEYEEYEENEKEVYSLKKSEIVFVGKSDVKRESVCFREDFIDLLKDKYISELSFEGKLKDCLDYMVMFYHSRTYDESFWEKKKIKVSILTEVEQVIDDVANVQGYNLMRLHLFSMKEDVIDSLFEHYIGREMKSIVDYGTCKIFFNEFKYKVQLEIYHNYKRNLQICAFTNNDAILLVYDVNDKSSFDCLNDIIDYFSKNNSKHIFFILGDKSNSAGDVLGEKSTGACTDSNENFDDNYVSEWCKKKEVEINKAGEEINAEENKINK